MTNDKHFTTLEILQAITNWKHEAFTLIELNLLLQFFLTENINTTSYEYGGGEIEDFILEILSEQLSLAGYDEE